MSRDGVHGDEMNGKHHPTHEQVEELLAGRAPADGDLAPVSAFLDEVRSAAADQAAPERRADLASVLAGGLPQDQLVGAVGGPIRRKVQDMASAIRGSTMGKIALGLGVGVFTLGGFGVAGALPGPVQDFVADTADRVGIDLPHTDRDCVAVDGHHEHHHEHDLAHSHVTADGEVVDRHARDLRHLHRAGADHRLCERETDRRPEESDRHPETDRPDEVDRPHEDLDRPETDRPDEVDRPHEDVDRPETDRPDEVDRPHEDLDRPETDRPETDRRPEDVDRPHRLD